MNTNIEKKNAPVGYLETDSLDSEITSPHRFVHQQIEVLLQDLYDRGQKGLREVDIVYAYIDQLKKDENIEYSYADQQPNVNRALKTLVKNGKVHKVDRRYFLLKPNNSKEIAEKTLVANVRLSKRNIFTISRSTVVLCPTEATLEVAKTWLTKYLGASCYGIANYDGYLIIMLTGKTDKLDILRNDLKTLAAKIYDKHTK